MGLGVSHHVPFGSGQNCSASTSGKPWCWVAPGSCADAQLYADGMYYSFEVCKMPTPTIGWKPPTWTASKPSFRDLCPVTCGTCNPHHSKACMTTTSHDDDDDDDGSSGGAVLSNSNSTEATSRKCEDYEHALVGPDGRERHCTQLAAVQGCRHKVHGEYIKKMCPKACGQCDIAKCDE